VGGLTESVLGISEASRGVASALLGLNGIPDMDDSNSRSILSSLLGEKVLVKEGTPAEYGPAIPAENIVDCLVRLKWVNKDDHGTLGLTPLGRALLRNHETAESTTEAYDVVVLDSHDELSYPMLIRTLAEVGEALLIDPYLRLEQLWPKLFKIRFGHACSRWSATHGNPVSYNFGHTSGKGVHVNNPCPALRSN
jgi:hypothetical protein